MAANTQSEMSPPSLTFGVEMEMVYVHQLSDFEKLTSIPTGPGNHFTARQRREYVASILRHELPAGNKVPSLLGKVNVDQDSTSYSTWTVTEDCSIGAGADEVSKIFHIPRSKAKQLLHWDQIELISPVFRFRSGKTWILQLHQIEADLASRAQLGASFCNESCGLHVHFALEANSGRRQQQPEGQQHQSGNNPDLDAPAFPLPVLQNLIILWAFWEKNIETFHPFYRHSNQCQYAKSLIASVRHLEGFNSWADWATHIYSLQSSEKIRNFLSFITPKYVKIHISTARPNKRETIEFREHRGTTSAAEIQWWIIFIERVIQYAWKTAHAGLRFFVPGAQKWDINNTEDIWQIIDMPHGGREFLRGKIYEYSHLDPSDFYQMSSSAETDLAGSQASMTGNADGEMDLDDENADPNYEMAYGAPDAVQPPVVELEAEKHGVPRAFSSGGVVNPVAE